MLLPGVEDSKTHSIHILNLDAKFAFVIYHTTQSLITDGRGEGDASQRIEFPFEVGWLRKMLSRGNLTLFERLPVVV